MMIKKRFGIGTIVGLLIVYLIFLYAKEKGWIFLASLSKWYLIITIIFFALPFIIFLAAVIFILLTFLPNIIKARKRKKHKKDDFVDVEYQIKE